MTTAGVSSAGRFDPELGVWLRIPDAAVSVPRPALFLDRDGVIVEDPGYLSRAFQMVVIPGSAEMIALANARGVPVIEVTNQAGIGRGYYGWSEFAEVEAALGRELARGGAAIDGVFACPFHRHGIGAWAHPAHPCRKPRPGMLVAAARLMGLDLARSWIVGDKLADLVAGQSAGLAGGVHVMTGHGVEHRPRVVGWKRERFELRLVDSIGAALDVIDLVGSAGAEGMQQPSDHGVG
jgi:D-glycero-D-manno-heptose 1,7-bisphosphate phosphatase